jgi:hypothetical protein
VVRVAPVVLRKIRIEQLSVENVPAVVDANLSGLLLGMSFLSRLKGFEMRRRAYFQLVTPVKRSQGSRIMSTRRFITVGSLEPVWPIGCCCIIERETPSASN